MYVNVTEWLQVLRAISVPHFIVPCNAWISTSGSTRPSGHVNDTPFVESLQCITLRVYSTDVKIGWCSRCNSDCAGNCRQLSFSAPSEWRNLSEMKRCNYFHFIKPVHAIDCYLQDKETRKWGKWGQKGENGRQEMQKERDKERDKPRRLQNEIMPQLWQGSLSQFFKTFLTVIYAFSSLPHEEAHEKNWEKTNILLGIFLDWRFVVRFQAALTSYGEKKDIILKC